MLGVVRAADGWVGINCLTGQHWLDVCAMLGLPEFGEQQFAIMMGGPERAEFFAAAQPWLSERTVAEIVELSQACASRRHRSPTAPARWNVRSTSSGGSSSTPARTAGRFDVRGRRSGSRRPPRRQSGPAPHSERRDRITLAATGIRSRSSLPFAGLKVLDLSTFWAGGYLTCYLGAFGADVVKLESIQRPDGFRYSGAYPHEGEDWYERSALWQATNLNKRDITLDLTSQAGRDLACRLAAQADVVVENFSPRVVEQFGLDYQSLIALRPDVIAVRMPGFGLDGPWRDYVGWALNIEQVSGMSAVTGYADGPPCNVQGPADPIVGVHAGVALLAALDHRRRTGEGQLIEVAQIEVGAAVTAEPVIEYSMNGVVRPRDGNRQRGCARASTRPTPTTRGWHCRCATTPIGRSWSTRWGPGCSMTVGDASAEAAHDVFDAGRRGLDSTAVGRRYRCRPSRTRHPRRGGHHTRADV